MATLATSGTSERLSDAELTPYEPGSGLPLFIQPTNSRLAHDGEYFHDWYWDHAAQIDDLLFEAGALVFRGFALRSTQEFDRLVEQYDRPRFGYAAGNSPRAQLGERVFEATSSPPYLRIGLHQEMCYLPTYPSRLLFFCRMPAVSGGETIIGDMRLITSLLDPHFVDAVDRLGILYTTNFRDRAVSTGNAYLDAVHKSWQDAFSTEDPERPIEDAEAMGLNAQWLDDGSLCVTYHGPGLIAHPRTGERLWFNQSPTLNLGPHNMPNYEMFEHHYGAKNPLPFVVTLGDGTPISTAQAQAVAATLGRCEVAFPWSSGDVLMIDNFRVAHGRNTFSGRRDIQVALVA